MAIEITPTLSISPQITNDINFSRTFDDCYHELDTFMRFLNFRKHVWFVDGSDSIKMKYNDGTNDNLEDTLVTVVEDGGICIFLPTALLYGIYATTSTPNEFMINVTYVNEIAKIISLDQSLLNLIFTFSSAPSVNGTKYTRGNIILNVVAGDHDLSGSVLTVTPDGNNDICITVSLTDYTDTFDGEAFGFNTMVSGKYMPKVTTLTGSDSHIVVKLRWIKADLATYVEDWIVLQNTGDTPSSGSMYLTVWQYDPLYPEMSSVYLGEQSWTKADLIGRMYSLTSNNLRNGDTIHNRSFNLNYSAWDRTQDYTMDATISDTSSFGLIPQQSWILRYENDIFLIYKGRANLVNNTGLFNAYTHIHSTLNNKVVETTECRTRLAELPVYQSTGSTCSWTFVGTQSSHGTFEASARLNTNGSWGNNTITGGPWARTTGLYYGYGVEYNQAGREGSVAMAMINYDSNLSFNLEKCENLSNKEFNIEPDLPNTLYVDDYINHTHITVNGIPGELGAPLEALLGPISPTTYAYTNGALSLDAVLGGERYTTPFRLMLAYDNGYHIVDLLPDPFKFSHKVVSDD